MENMIYLDHAASSPLRSEVWEAMSAVIGAADFNAASLHACGRQAQETLERARADIAKVVGASRGEVFFTSGGTASDNVAVLGFIRRRLSDNPRIVTSAIEHKAVMLAARQAATEGAGLEILPVDEHGQVDPAALDRVLAAGSSRPTLVSIMWANNEVGTIQPIAELVEVAHRHGATFHTDAVQGFGKLDMRHETAPVDLLTATAHKLGGPVGIGVLVCRRGTCLEPLVYGGTQERGVWPGTQNPIGAVGFAKALELCVTEKDVHVPHFLSMRETLETRFLEEIPNVVVHACGAPQRLPNLLSIGIPACDQATTLVALDMAGVAISSGSACSSGATTGSHVLEAMGLGSEEDYTVLRLSFGPHTSDQEIQTAGDAVIAAVAGARATLAN
ncbi:MAG: cysteine desulfurase [Gemmatimonadetes bacterium]|nr:MAG: cysteine desulfurase [Gemmatimonadota bacterium]